MTSRAPYTAFVTGVIRKDKPGIEIGMKAHTSCTQIWSKTPRVDRRGQNPRPTISDFPVQPGPFPVLCIL